MWFFVLSNGSYFDIFLQRKLADHGELSDYNKNEAGVTMENRPKLLVVLGIAVAILGIGTYSLWPNKHVVETVSYPPAAAAGHTPSAPAKDDEALVYVSGAVNRPGLYKIDTGKRVNEVINKAGGFTPDADVNKVNLAQVIKDGMHINVPLLGPQASAGSKAGSGTVRADGKININTADKAALDKLPGIGPATAEKIIDYRNTHGSFSTEEDLKKVPGIGDAKFQQLKDKITVQ